MKAIHSGIGGVAVVSLLFASPANEALALPPDSSKASKENVDDAGALVARGIALRHAGNDAGALQSFREAERVEPDSTRVQVHLANAYQALGQWEEADRYLTLAMRDPDDGYVQKHRDVLAAARRMIDAHIGSLQISGGPKGTEVRLNGRSLGTLPIQRTVRIEAGTYELEARLPGHYPVTRSVALAGGTLVREAIRLMPESADERPFVVPAEPPSSGPQWLAWVFGGLAVGAGAATAAAWAHREQHVANWNDDSLCLAPGQTRGDVCAGERRDGDRAETWMWIGGAATGAFAAASFATFWVTSAADERSTSALGCDVRLGLLHCSGRF